MKFVQRKESSDRRTHNFDIPPKYWVKLPANKHIHRKSVVSHEPFFNPKGREFVIAFEAILLSSAFKMLFKLRRVQSFGV